MSGSRPVTSDQEIRNFPLKHLGYFLEWGGEAWERLLRYAINHFLGVDLSGHRMLDIGTRYGKMACLFGLLGAKVVGTDIHEKSLGVAQQEATQCKVTERVVFVLGSGDLSAFRDNTFDVVFSKSVLVVVPDLLRYLHEVRAKLKPGGKIMFLENARGPWWMHRLRAFWHRTWDYSRARYFTSQELKLVSEVFDVTSVKKTLLPPIVLILGHKR